MKRYRVRRIVSDGVRRRGTTAEHQQTHRQEPKVPRHCTWQPVFLGFHVVDDVPSKVASRDFGGAIHQAVKKARKDGMDVSHIHLRHIWPLPRNLGELLKTYDKVIVAEMNMGQLNTLLRSQYLLDTHLLSKVSGQPFKISEITNTIVENLGDAK